ncbi:Periplasmic nitrate reductase, electron transfer subunit [Vibrio chagasii]|jgi:cytochrome c-type protein NapB|uniref:nitrate reductase cytochrome c-type subunit n=1 Tax=Vibrio TaxID=662 RepID=UPI000CF46D5B|nr:MULTISPECIES: nitrate reductase cytochrome c-type subunit [Vibrio]MCG9561240.1 nitrate reductase cytochrome c-type subunit [Vibrio chagasii]MCG9673787.1 nitrate reductase cytochrome c-type subunit [Vibrio chagasii]MCG9695054.1 nitrate reductase cytochrome c-type subunit [Vibrio sp. Isolate22]NOI93824.1 nitrate reductase cytochrome c-type subunit [Vibrio sp. T3Y01]PQJ51068.1 periplasmic nitrate reductase electron transfer subunit [Vibrio splendidus]
MKKLITALLSAGLLLAGVAQAELDNPGGIGGVESLRGASELEATRPADDFKKFPRDQVLESDYVYQPPLVPHTIRSYEVSLNANKCLSCHSWKNAKEMGATKISVTHYMNREDAVLADVSPRRYFCLQCHVPQASAKPLVENEFKPVDSLR